MPDGLTVNLMQAASARFSLRLFVPMRFSLLCPSLAKFFAGEPATGYGALPLSYARHLRTATAAGFEPATSRLTVEVTHVFTTGKEDLIFCKRRSMLRLCETNTARPGPPARALFA